MGAKFTPSMASLYMGWWEEHFLFSHLNPYKQYIFWYARYIDDLILIWTNTDTTLMQFIQFANSNNLNLEFSLEN